MNKSVLTLWVSHRMTTETTTGVVELQSESNFKMRMLLLRYESCKIFSVTLLAVIDAMTLVCNFATSQILFVIL